MALAVAGDDHPKAAKQKEGNGKKEQQQVALGKALKKMKIINAFARPPLAKHKVPSISTAAKKPEHASSLSLATKTENTTRNSMQTPFRTSTRQVRVPMIVEEQQPKKGRMARTRP